ncbi:cathepsin O-like [Bacillus rossius redtenbacheri]|uniref:cathepsin O-like n=1 Tax=Bacillus rossius redtenbacheri TaxID=93214 RepID=UPI002FDE6159
MVFQGKTVFVAVCVIVLLFLGIPIHIEKESDKPAEHLFTEYVSKFNKNYKSNITEFMSRYETFKETLAHIRELNQNQPPGGAVYGLTKFSDMSPGEFQERHLQPRMHHHIRLRLQRRHNDSLHHNHHQHQHHHNHVQRRAVGDDLPLVVDWRKKKVVTPVRNQKTCGACWAFSTVETVETMSALKTGVLQSLSVQEVVDCAKNGNLGCDGGDSCNLVEWLVTNNVPVEPEKEYPLAWQTQTCRIKASDTGVRVAPNFTCNYMVGEEDALARLLARHGPVAVAVNAANWQNYLGGIVQFHCDGALQLINHAVQLVGFDRTGPVPFYIARNSWGTDFGDKGYIYLSMGANTCGVGTEVVSLDVL